MRVRGEATDKVWHPPQWEYMCQRGFIITLMRLLRVFAERAFFPFLDPRRELLFGPKEGQPQAPPLPPASRHRTQEGVAQ